MASVFWGLKMESGKKYSTTVDKSFHISKAALDPSSVPQGKDGEVVSVVLEESGGGSFFLTNLRKKDQLCSNLDLNFMTGDKITLFCKGTGVVHLTGYMILDDEDDDISTAMLDEECEEEEEDEEINEEEDDVNSILNSMKANKKKMEAANKRKLKNENSKKAKKKKLETPVSGDSDEEDEEEDSDEENGMNNQLLEQSSDNEDGEKEDDEGLDEEDDDDDDEEDDDDDLEMEEDEEEVKPLTNKQKKQLKLQQKGNKAGNSVSTNKPQQNGVASLQQKGQMKKDEGKKEGPKTPQEKQNKQPGGETTLTGGVKIKDIREGKGQPCKPGKHAVVYYTGRLKSNGKVFDCLQQGSGFKFKVGGGEVIKGWDIGVSNMKVGGKRIITCPPQVAYGAKGAPPKIPPNSTLVFEVELKNVI